MTTIISKRHPLKFYGTVILGVPLLFALATFFMFASFEALQDKHPAPKEYSWPFVSLLVYYIAGSTLYSYLKNAPKIIVDAHTITFGDQTFYLHDIKAVVLTAKMAFRNFINIPKEGASILFHDGTEKVIFDDMYSNAWEIKSFLNQVVINKQHYTPFLEEDIDRNAVKYETVETFKGNQFINFRGIVIWGMIGVFTFKIIDDWGESFVISFMIMIVFFFALFSWHTYYFGLTRDYLIVKNHNFLWVNKMYAIKDIKEVVYETKGNLPNGMRIITKDFQSNLYWAATLGNKTWLELKRRLEAEGITVRNEIFLLRE